MAKVRKLLSRCSDEEILGLKLRELPVKIERSFLDGCIRRLYMELDRKNVRFKPPVWLSNEWFSPDGIPGIAAPFYLAHPRLMKLEAAQMFQIEGGTEAECMRILRHEAGHAIDTAYRFHFRKRWREVFGSFAAPYPEFYKPLPDSRDYVYHLDAWYAQAHPAEDFAETFAIWLTPGSKWQERYRGWPAISKLEYVDELMREVAGKYPYNKKKKLYEPLSQLSYTVAEHYRAKREKYGNKWPDFYDRDLKRIFSDEPKYKRRTLAARFIRTHRSHFRQVVAEWTGAYQYTIDQVLKEIITRSQNLKLRLVYPERVTTEKVTIMLTVQTLNFVLSGHHRVSL